MGREIPEIGVMLCARHLADGFGFKGMKLRHAAARALVGWYLMFPPVDYRNAAVLTTAPLKTWELFRSFDTASECNDYRDANIREDVKVESKPVNPQEEERMDRLLKWGAGTSKKTRGIGLKRANASLCIASDDPRLKEK